jgi:hypothetical protein
MTHTARAATTDAPPGASIVASVVCLRPFDAVYRPGTRYSTPDCTRPCT